MKCSKVGKRVVIDCTVEEAEHISQVLEYTANHGLCMGMCGGSLNGIYIRVKQWIKLLDQTVERD